MYIHVDKQRRETAKQSLWGLVKEDECCPEPNHCPECAGHGLFGVLNTTGAPLHDAACCTTSSRDGQRQGCCSHATQSYPQCQQLTVPQAPATGQLPDHAAVAICYNHLLLLHLNPSPELPHSLLQQAPKLRVARKVCYTDCMQKLIVIHSLESAVTLRVCLGSVFPNWRARESLLSGAYHHRSGRCAKRLSQLKAWTNCEYTLCSSQ